MEVAIGSNGNPPFQREVREWQRVDPNTGALLTGRLEADRWITGPQNAYGKVVDSQNVSQPNGIQHTQRKQLEVLQARTSSGSLQVVRAQTQTVQTSSSRWSSTSSSGTKTTQSLTGQRFSIPLQMITNGNHHPSSSPMTNGSHDTHHFSHSNGHHQLITEPSLKLSSLMKNSAASSNSSSRSSPRSPTMFGSAVSQRHHHEVAYPTAKVAERGGGSSFEAYSRKLHDSDAERSMSETSDTDRLPQLHRGRSVSNDDLASSDHWDRGNDEENGDDTADWRRVSKIRRSFQFPKSSSPPKSSPIRPPDLPENSVSVSRIRDELESGHRLSAVMRSDHADLVALDNLLNGSDSPPSPAMPPETDTKLSKKPSFLTADSLKEIRGKLKKLSNEPLYKEDFNAQLNGEKMKPYEEQQHDFTIEKPVVLNDSKAVHQPTYQIKSKVETSHNTNSLENRTRHRDTTSSEWYLRRKSYGFERMTPQSNQMSRQETSTDSGLGRSGELNSWSPTESAPRGTIITFGENPVVQTKASITFMNGGPVQRYRGTYDPTDESVEIKRHSIAVDESKYVRDNVRNAFEAKSSININGYYTREIDSAQSTVIDENGRRQKRVEFCKTEVHFAAESGRVNIVETDGKPPPTSNFRRRRRGSGGPISSAYMEAITSGKPVVHFGDEAKAQVTQSAVIEESNNVTVITNGTPDVVVPCPKQEEESPESDEVSIRGILKNKPVKPKPFLLGENIESSESLWGVRLRPVSSDISSLKPDEVPTGKRDIAPVANSSVAERVRIVEERNEGTGYSTKINLNLSNSPYSWEAPELPKSNVMTIELHSPTGTLQRKTKEVPAKPYQEIPTPKPRQSVVATTSTKHNSEVSIVERVDHARKSITDYPPQPNREAPLKIETGGARKLKDHELLYFGVKAIHPDEHQRPHPRTITSTSSNKVKETKEKLMASSNTVAKTNETTSDKWKLSSDKPDLLRHSPSATTNPEKRIEKPATKTRIEEVANQEIRHKGPVYENLKKPSALSRKRDTERDQKILKEMAEEAEQSLQAISSDKASKSHHRRSSLRSSKPLETIDEKRSSKRHPNESKSAPSQSSDSQRRRSCCSNRSNSFSSTESLTRLTDSFRSKSQRKETPNEQQVASVRRSSLKSKDSPLRKSHHRSSSRETQRTTASSSEDLHNGVHRGHHSDDDLRRSRRTRPSSSSREREKERMVLKVDENQRITRSTVRTADDRTTRGSGCKGTSDSSTTKGINGSIRSTKSDKSDVKSGTTKSKVASSRSSTNDTRKMSRTKTTSAVVPTSTSSSSSKRSSRDHTRK